MDIEDGEREKERKEKAREKARKYRSAQRSALRERQKRDPVWQQKLMERKKKASMWRKEEAKKRRLEAKTSSRERRVGATVDPEEAEKPRLRLLEGGLSAIGAVAALPQGEAPPSKEARLRAAASRLRLITAQELDDRRRGESGSEQEDGDGLS